MAGKDKMVKCFECKHGRYMQWMKNPIICECNWTGERYSDAFEQEQLGEVCPVCGRPAKTMVYWGVAY